MADRDDLIREVDRISRLLLHTSQHHKMIIGLAERIQDDVDALRTTFGLPVFRWNDYVPDEEAGRCAADLDEDCRGQHTHTIQ